MHFDSALRTTHTLPGDAPQQTLALVAVGGRGGRPHLEIVGRGAGDRVDQSLEGLLVHMVLLRKQEEEEEGRDRGGRHKKRSRIREKRARQIFLRCASIPEVWDEV